MSATLDPTVIRNAILKGFGIGIGVVGLSTLFLIPFSATMNYFVHHHASLRILMGILGGLGFLFTLPILFFHMTMNPTEYEKSIEPLLLKKEGGADTYSQHMLLGNPITVRKGAVPEEFFEAAKEAGALSSDQWAKRMKELELSTIGQTLFVS
jgi:hypothetical protein